VEGVLVEAVLQQLLVLLELQTQAEVVVDRVNMVLEALEALE